MDYEKQAQDFLNKVGATLEVRFIKYDLYFPQDKEKRDIFEFRLTKGDREYISGFGDSIHSTEERMKNVLPLSMQGDRGIRYYRYSEEQAKEKGQKLSSFTGDFSIRTAYRNVEKLYTELSEWHTAGSRRDTLSAYSILASLDGYEPSDNVDDFASDYGYVKPSEALKVFNAVQEQYQSLLTLFNSEEMQELSEIS